MLDCWLVGSEYLPVSKHVAAIASVILGILVLIGCILEGLNDSEGCTVIP
jgi:hypothetical protein